MTGSNQVSPIDGAFVKMLCSDHPEERQKAWALLYQQCYPQVRSILLRNGADLDEVRDLFHDALVALLKNLKENKFESRSSVATYLCGICFKMYCKKCHKDGKKIGAELEFWQAEMLSPSYDPTRDLLWDRIATALMGKLKAECRDILVEFYFNKRSMKELVEQFNVSTEQAAKNKKMRCLGYLRDLVENSHINPQLQEI
ncbi:MAG: sigma-70 family RNA polymerase sigma factor [Chryseolinea sp.]